MIEWLKLSDGDRLLTLQQASGRSGMSIKALEKDWWVTLALKAVFQSIMLAKSFLKEALH